ncbi:MAG: EAL domain-containing protein [Acholeplasma sp.]|nr:EAL domain-containing protein [Acholeplasma sp.]
MLELTEGQEVSDWDKLEEAVKELKSLGFQISLDDFGTGYNSLKTFARLQVDEIKIDKSFIDGFPYESENVVLTIIALAKSSQKRIVAEGVENKIQLKGLEEIGGIIVQGYVYSRPLDIEAFIAFNLDNK